MNAPVQAAFLRRMRPEAVIAAIVTGLVAVLLAAGGLWNLQTHLADVDGKAVKLLESPATSSRGAVLARQVLKRSPYTPKIASALALSWARSGDTERASQLMTASGALSWRDLFTNLWLFETRLQAGDLKGAIDRADASLRIRPDISPTLFPALVDISKNNAAAAEIAKHMAANPDWRPALINMLSIKADPSVTFNVLMNVNTTRSPATAAEVSRYLVRLVELDKHEEALLGLFLFLPPQKMTSFKNVFNGDFNQITGIEPFDWNMKTVPGASVSLEDGPYRDNNRALHVLYQGSNADTLMSQLIVLPEGPYRFSGETMASAPEYSEGLTWSVRCTHDPVLGTQTAARSTESWGRFQFDLVVPPGCGAQFIELKVAPGERRVSIDSWFDKITIERLGVQ